MVRNEMSPRVFLGNYEVSLNFYKDHPCLAPRNPVLQLSLTYTLSQLQLLNRLDDVKSLPFHTKHTTAVTT
jgi:hypothetical protein